MMNHRTHRDVSEGLCLLRLMVRGLRDEAPDGLPSGLSWDRVFSLAVQNRIEGLTWHSACHKASDMPDGLAHEWEKRARATELRRIQFDAERELLVEALSNAGISAMPVKGAAFAHLYPALDMRAMGDNDILYGLVERGDDGVWHVCGQDFDQRLKSMGEARDRLVGVMGELGYVAHVDAPLLSCHDYKFTKPPFLVFEMHHALTNKWASEELPFSDPWAGAKRVGGGDDSGTGCVLRMSREAEYAYFVFHAFKHLLFGGVGIRVLADLRVLLDAWESDMDWELVKGYLGPPDALGFEADLRGLCDRVFSDALEPGDDRWIARMVSEGVYGLPTNKSYANHARSLARRLGLKGPEELLGHPMMYLGMGEVSRPLMPLFSAAWRGVQAARAFGLSRV